MLVTFRSFLRAPHLLMLLRISVTKFGTMHTTSEIGKSNRDISSKCRRIRQKSWDRSKRNRAQMVLYGDRLKPNMTVMTLLQLLLVRNSLYRILRYGMAGSNSCRCFRYCMAFRDKNFATAIADRSWNPAHRCWNGIQWFVAVVATKVNPHGNSLRCLDGNRCCRHFPCGNSLFW
jgi:hypothetical protein